MELIGGKSGTNPYHFPEVVGLQKSPQRLAKG
jgi:hypothetical protein